MRLDANCGKQPYFEAFKRVTALVECRDLIEIMRPVEMDGETRHKVYPGQDERVVRIVKKAIRGLCHYHHVLSPVREKRVWVDVHKYPIPGAFLSEMAYEHREQDIAEYRYQVLHESGIHSAWIITFFQRIAFIGIVSMTEDGSFLEEVG